MTLLEVEDLTVRYGTPNGPVTAVSNASFTIDSGEYFGVVGESGCGKSTIAKVIVGALDDNGSIESGTIRYNGTEIQDRSQRYLNEHLRWKEISLIPQSSMNVLDPLRRISSQAREIAKVHGHDEDEALDRAEELFELMGIQGERIAEYPHQFSGGMRQRATIALGLFLDPSLIIADEPTTALDVIMQDQIVDYLNELRDELNTSMILITHDISLVFESCDSMAVMHGGQIAESGTTRDVYYSPKHPYSIMLQRAFPDIRYPERELEVIEGQPPQTIGDVEQCTYADRCPLAVEECYAHEPSLERVSDESRSHFASCFRSEESHTLLDRSADGSGTDG